MSTLVFLDVEATGVDQTDRLVQVAYRAGDTDVNELFTPPVPMRVTAMAVHHITNKHLADKPAFNGSKTHSDLIELSQSDDAWGDIVVLEAVFKKLYEEIVAKDFASQPPVVDAVINQMIEISNQPSLVVNFTFGKYAGKTIEQVAKIDKDYLKWLLNEKLKKPENEDDWIFTLRKHINGSK